MKRCFKNCALCRRESILTFEHIPPRAAFNNLPAKPVSGDKLIKDNNRMPWDMKGLSYNNQQRGMGKFSLCQECNNNTGAWYGNEYTSIAHLIHNFLGHAIPERMNVIKIPEIYPLRFCKQILSMFCSINNFEDPRLEHLRRFVLNKEEVGIDKLRYRLCMYLTRSTMMKYAPLSVLLTSTNHGFEKIVLSEITAYPLGFILYFDPCSSMDYEGVDITCFTDCKYDDKVTIEMPLCIKEMNDVFPTFFRTKEEINDYIDP